MLLSLFIFLRLASGTTGGCLFLSAQQGTLPKPANGHPSRLHLPYVAMRKKGKHGAQRNSISHVGRGHPTCPPTRANAEPCRRRRLLAALSIPLVLLPSIPPTVSLAGSAAPAAAPSRPARACFRPATAPIVRGGKGRPVRKILHELHPGRAPVDAWRWRLVTLLH